MTRNTWKISKSFWRRKRKKAKNGSKISFTDEETEKRRQNYRKHKQKLPEDTRNYYLTHKKQLLSCFEGQLNLCHELVIEMWKNSEIFYELKNFVAVKIFE